MANPNPFTPEEVAQILEAFFAAVGTRQYIGARYVPIFGRKGEESIIWDNSAPYERLTIVLYQGNSFTSRQYVPAGVEITNEEFWAETGNYNAQVEQYRQEVSNLRDTIDEIQNTVDENYEKNFYILVSDFTAGTDTENIQAAIEAAKQANGKKTIVFEQDKEYITENRIDLDGLSNVELIGNGAIISHGKNYGFFIGSTSHDVYIHDFVFAGTFEPNDTITNSNACIGISGPSNTNLYDTYNIFIERCKFTFGVFGIAATNTMGLNVSDCSFYGGTYRPEDAAGGYGILEQSCINVNIERCYFEIGDYGRHDIYISVKQTKVTNKVSKNVYIHDCFSDRSNMNQMAGGGYFSTNTVRIAVRSCTNFHVDGFYSIGGTGVIAIGNEDGPQNNAIIENIYTYGNVFIASSIGAAESRAAINVLGSQNETNNIDVEINNLHVENADVNFLDISGEADTLTIKNMIVNYRIQISGFYKKTWLHLINIGVKSSGALSYSGDSNLIGKFENFYNANKTGVLTCGTTSGNGKIDLSCYQSEAKTCRIGANGTLTWQNSELAHPIMTVDNSNTDYRKIVMTYTTKPLNGILSSVGSGVIGFFNFDSTHDTGENSARIYIYDSDGTVNLNKNVLLVLV